MDGREKREKDFINKSIEAYEIARKLLQRNNIDINTIDINTTGKKKQIIINAIISSSVKLAEIKMHK